MGDTGVTSAQDIDYRLTEAIEIGRLPVNAEQPTDSWTEISAFVKFLIVDDHTLFREALILLLREFDPAVTLIEAASSEEALSALDYYSDLDMILLDLGLPGVDGLSILPRLRESAPTVPVVVLSAADDPGTAREALAAGAVGFISKTAGSQEMKNALHLVLNGEVYAPLGILTDAGPARPPQSDEIDNPPTTHLTQRQLDVLGLLAEGLPNKLIARRLDLSEATVKLHVSAILRCLSAQNRTEAVLEASRRRLID